MSKQPTRQPTKRKTIVFQGEPGANSHIACAEAYPNYTPVPCPTFEDAFAALIAQMPDRSTGWTFDEPNWIRRDVLIKKRLGFDEAYWNRAGEILRIRDPVPAGR